MTVFEVGICKLRKPYSADELSTSEEHNFCLETVRRQPGCLGIQFGVCEDYTQQLVWLIEWQNKSDHVDRWVGSSEHTQVLETLGKILTPSDEGFMTHFDINPALKPAQMVSPAYPVLEVYVFTLQDGVTREQLEEGFHPITEEMDRRKQSWSLSKCTDEEGKNRWLYLIAWPSLAKKLEAHNERIEAHNERIEGALVEHRKMCKSVEIYGHFRLQSI